MRRRLYLQIYLAFVGIAVVCIVVASVSAHLFRDEHMPMYELAHNAAGFLVEDLTEMETASTQGREALRAALKARADRFGLDIALWDAKRQLIAASGPVPRFADFPGQRLRWSRRHHEPGLIASLNGGGWVFVGLRKHDHAATVGWGLLVLVLLMGTIAVGCFWIARRITRRLENLQEGVERWGAGAICARVPIQGRDEVAALATSFNEAAERIEGLLKQQKRVLAHVSHELRSPLARLRMAIELLGSGRELEASRRDELRQDSSRDIQELDELIGDLLLVARLEGASKPPELETVDLHALVSEECSSLGVPVEGTALEMRGDARMLRRLVRNLLDNARRYGGDRQMEVRLEALGSSQDSPTGVRLVVADRGPGIAEADRERIFEPFYRPGGHGETRDGGVGLGLSLVKQIAEHHGGTVRYLPRSGGGSRFEVDFPVGSNPGAS